MSLSMDSKLCPNLPVWIFCFIYSVLRENTVIYIVKVWQKLCVKGIHCCQPVVTGKVTFLTGQENLFPHNFSAITNQNTPKTLKPLFFCVCVCVWLHFVIFQQQDFFFPTPQFFLHFILAVFSFLTTNFRDFILVSIGRISGAGLHRPIIYSLTWIFQAVAHLSLSRCWVPSRAALILRDTGPDVAYLKNKFSTHVDPALWVTGLRGI